MSYQTDLILYKNKTGWQLAEKLINISFEGLKNGVRKIYGDDETVHLDYLFEVIDKRNCIRKAKNCIFKIMN